MQPSSGVCDTATSGNGAGQAVDLSQIAAACSALLSAVQAVQNQNSHFPSPPVGSSTLLVDLANSFMESKVQAVRSDNYLRVLLGQVRHFVTGRESRSVYSITSAEIEHWLHSRKWAPKTKRGHLLTLRNLFNWAVARQLLAVNPALAVDMPAAVERLPVVLTPPQVRQLLESALVSDPSACRCLAVRFFAGLRTSEAVNLEEKEILPGFVEVTAAKAKTRRRRLVRILPVLRAWLAVTAAAGGRLPLPQFNNRLAAVVKLGGVPWAPGAARHSFASYHLARFRSSASTALECGHTEAILFSNYREIVTPAAARAFFGLFPGGKIGHRGTEAPRPENGDEMTPAVLKSPLISNPSASVLAKNGKRAGRLRVSLLLPGRGRRSY